ncbi:hypothetical protein A9308_07085 [Moraxella atlantae]|uniref:histidine kinase n=1 Tax=Faucicola atlantae TaxID=34059 RepID=A0A1B8QBV4_9GAMM|nr:ATP-binding protein [Moraxella atlantae]OBX78175.1 hypothetical protein A9308_07085 [Moraxella atlantae]
MITNPTFSSQFAVERRTDQAKRLSLIYNIYRCVIGVLFSVNFLLSLNWQGGQPFGQLTPELTVAALPSVGYLVFALLFLAGYQHKPHNDAMMAALVVDNLVLSLLLYVSGGSDLQIVLLLLVLVAAAFMLVHTNQAILLTAFALVLVIYQQYYPLLKDASVETFNNAVLVAVSFVVVGYFSHSLAKRLKQIESLSARQTDEVNALNAINQKIVQIIEQGVLVVSHDLDILLANDVASRQLNLNQPLATYQLATLSPTLAQTLTPIIATQEHTAVVTLAAPQAAIPSAEGSGNQSLEYRVRVTQLDSPYALVLLEDLRREHSRAQQLKLASLGQLSASIAHEIRNPLAAISQASQLLLEDSQNDDGVANGSLDDDQRVLLDMVYQQTVRVNRIIEDVLRLSRQQPPNQQRLSVSPWLSAFVRQHYVDKRVALDCRTHATFWFDPQQLEQVLINLINNGLRFSQRDTGTACVHVTVYDAGQYVHIDVIDTGAGVPAANVPYLFDPFFTTDNQGTGLGLYLSQAFCQANQAALDYIAHHAQTCFRISCPMADG